MTLSEAAKTGRHFRRSSEPEVWYWLEGRVIHRCIAGAIQTFQFDAEAITSNDWEPEPLKLEITAQDILRAAREHDQIASQRRLSAAEFGKLICGSLGLLE